MDIELFTICHSAMEDRGNLSILGIFDRIHAPAFPFQFPHWTLALRFRFRRTEMGKHKIVMSIVDLDGRDLVPHINGELDLRNIPPGCDSGTVNMILEMHAVPIQKPGKYSLDFSIDGRQERALPLWVVHDEKLAGPRPPEGIEPPPGSD